MASDTFKEGGKIKFSDIDNLQNTSITTGKITCSSIECSGQITGGGYTYAGKVTTVYNGWIPLVDESVTLSYQLLSFDFVILQLVGFFTNIQTVSGRCFTYSTSSENPYTFYSYSSHEWLVKVCFPNHGWQLKTVTNTTGITNPSIRIEGINYFT